METEAEKPRALRDRGTIKRPDFFAEPINRKRKSVDANDSLCDAKVNSSAEVSDVDKITKENNALAVEEEEVIKIILKNSEIYYYVYDVNELSILRNLLQNAINDIPVLSMEKYRKSDEVGSCEITAEEEDEILKDCKKPKKSRKKTGECKITVEEEDEILKDSKKPKKIRKKAGGGEITVEEEDDILKDYKKPKKIRKKAGGSEITAEEEAEVLKHFKKPNKSRKKDGDGKITPEEDEILKDSKKARNKAPLRRKRKNSVADELDNGNVIGEVLGSEKISNNTINNNEKVDCNGNEVGISDLNEKSIGSVINKDDNKESSALLTEDISISIFDPPSATLNKKSPFAYVAETEFQPAVKRRSYNYRSTNFQTPSVPYFSRPPVHRGYRHYLPPNVNNAHSYASNFYQQPQCAPPAYNNFRAPNNSQGSMVKPKNSFYCQALLSSASNYANFRHPSYNSTAGATVFRNNNVNYATTAPGPNSSYNCSNNYNRNYVNINNTVAKRNVDDNKIMKVLSKERFLWNGDSRRAPPLSCPCCFDVFFDGSEFEDHYRLMHRSIYLRECGFASTDVSGPFGVDETKKYFTGEMSSDDDPRCLDDPYVPQLDLACKTCFKRNVNCSGTFMLFR